MKTQAIGEISRGGGFTRFIRDIQDSQEPAIIMRNNEAVAVTFPIQTNLIKFVEAFQSFLSIIRNQIQSGMSDDFELFLMTQLLTGSQAKSLLSRVLTDKELLEIETMVSDFTRPIVEGILLNPNGRLRLPRVVDALQNSSEESGSVPPMTTARADVSTVKQEELPLGDSSLPRKRGRPRKELSPSQKRKIGMKRETSASKRR